jgi:hypothetical protein
MSAGCHKPVTVSYVGRKDTFVLKHHHVEPKVHDPLTWESVEVIVDAKCRQCEHCLRKRRQHWWFRARAETNLAPRTWFATFTFTPEHHYRVLLLARQRAARKGLDWDGLSETQQFGALVDVAGAEITLFFKRVRKDAKGPLRYLLVSEAHESGLPHFHALIHEVTANAVAYAVLKRHWRCGFSTFKLADEKAPAYLAKYISKDARCRVRASAHYGSNETAYALAASKELEARSGSGVKQIVTGKETFPRTETNENEKGSQ